MNKLFAMSPRDFESGALEQAIRSGHRFAQEDSVLGRLVVANVQAYSALLKHCDSVGYAEDDIDGIIHLMSFQVFCACDSETEAQQ